MNKILSLVLFAIELRTMIILTNSTMNPWILTNLIYNLMIFNLQLQSSSTCTWQMIKHKAKSKTEYKFISTIVNEVQVFQFDAKYCFNVTLLA